MAFTFMFSLSANKKSSNLNFQELFILNAAYAEGEEDDERNSGMTNNCKNGSSCECVICESGNTDCSPSCPCCHDGEPA